MTELERRLETDLTAAMRSRSEDLTLLRGLKAALHNERIAKRAELSEPDVLSVLRRELKRRSEAQALYLEAGRTELSQKERTEAAVIARYLPQAPDVLVIRQAMERIKAEQNLTGAQGIGPLTKATLEHFQGAVDGKTVSGLARELLAQS